MTQRNTVRFSKWWLVILGALAMGAAGTYQFVWSSIRLPIGTQIGAAETSLGTLFTILVVFQTISQFPAGWFRDRYGPRLPLFVGTILLSAGYAGLALSSTLLGAALAVSVGGTGSGIVYNVTINTPVKWFDDRQGLATGIVVMAFPGVSAGLIPLIRGGVKNSLTLTLMVLAAFVAVIGLAGAGIIRDPFEESDERAQPDASDGTEEPTDDTNTVDLGDAESYQWHETIRTGTFWLLYVVFIIVHGVGLMLIEKVIAFSEALGLTATAATGAASIIAIAEGAGVLIGGASSDRFGSVRTIGTSLVLSALGIVGAVLTGNLGLNLGFVVMVGIAAFFRGPIFSILPGLVGRYYGTAHSSENYAVLYSGKLWGSVVGGVVTSYIIGLFGWTESFLLGAGLLGGSGLLMFTLIYRK